MKTKIEGIEINIDDAVYHISYRFPSVKEKEELEALSATDTKAQEDYMKLNNELKILEAKRINNESLIPLVSGTEKLEVLKEQREIIKKIETIAPKIEKAGKYKYSVEAAAKRYELLVGGVDKDRLKEDAQKLDISISVVMDEVINGVVKAQEKK